jgi:hypothetical protein
VGYRPLCGLTDSVVNEGDGDVGDNIVGLERA